MYIKHGRREGRWRPGMGLLKWVAIVLPTLFLISVDVLRHTVFSQQIHTLPGSLGFYVLIALAIIVFSYAMFGLIDRLQLKVTDQNRQLASLNNIAKATAAKLRLEELLDTSLDQLLSSMRADAGLICLVDMEKEEHSAVSHRGFSTELVRGIQRAKLAADPVALEVVRTGRPVIQERAFENPQVAAVARREGIRSALTAPLKSEEEVNGILVIATRKERHFSETDREFLEAVGGQLGMVIRNALLYRQSDLQNRELSALLAVGKAVTTTSSSDLEEMLCRALDTIIEVVSADAAEVWVMEDREELLMRCHRGAHREAFLEQTKFRLGEGLPGIVAQSQEPVVVHDLPSDARFLRQGVVKAGYQTFCALPLSYQRGPVGVLAVAALSAEAIRGRREIHLLEGIGEWLALAIENARLYQQVGDLAILQERERIAREMHDGMAQLLGYINTQTIAVKTMLSKGQAAEAREELTKMEEIAHDLYADVREGILGLRIAARQGKGLLAALREYTERYMEMSGIQVEMKGSPEAEGSPLVPSIEIQLMRIVQESLTNVRKHSKASVVSVTFEQSDLELRATIADNGQGFELARLPSTGWPHFGLQTMRERAEALGGTLAIDTAPGQGTRVEVRIPLASRVAEA